MAQQPNHATTMRPAVPEPAHNTPAPAATGLPASFAALSGANLAAQAAEQISLAAVPIVAVMALGAGPGSVGLINTAQSLPFLLLSIPLGLWVDRHSRQRLMLAAEGLRVLALLGLWWVAAGAQPALWALAVLGFLGATGTVGFSVAAPALVPGLVPREALGAANGRLELARSLAFAAGPALAGGLVGWAGAGAAFALATALSVSALLLLRRVPEPPRAPAPPRHPLSDIADGARFVWRQPLLRPVLLTAVAWNLAWCVMFAAYVPHAMGALKLDAAGVGLTLGVCGAGMVIGALAARRVLAALPFGLVVMLGPLVSVAASAAMLATLWWPSGWLAGLAFFLFGVGPILWTISSTTLRQTVVPHAMLGRVSAIFITVNTGARPLGAAIGALVGAQGGTSAALWLSLALFALQAAVISLSAVRTLKALPSTAG